MNGQNYFLEETDFISYLLDQGFHHILELIILDLPLKDIINNKKTFNGEKVEFYEETLIIQKKKLCRNFNQMSCHLTIALEKHYKILVELPKDCEIKFLGKVRRKMVNFLKLSKIKSFVT
jgi:hypothetical protein